MELGPVREGEIEERLVALALDQLSRPALGPDRLADAADRTAPVLVCELAPRGDDAGGVGPHLRHVGEVHKVGLAAELGPQRLDLGCRQHGQRRLSGLRALAQERGGALQELLVVRVEERLVLEGGPLCN